MDLDPYVGRLFQIESGGDPNARTGSNRGLGQFGPSEEARYGITDANRTDPQAQAAAVQKEAAEHSAVLSRALGRPPTPGELYLAHQQGIAGAPALLSAQPGTPAWQAIRPYYKSDAIAKEAISGNPFTKGMDPNISAADFANGWKSKFEGIAQHDAIPAPSAPILSPQMAAGAPQSAPTPSSPQVPAAAQGPSTAGLALPLGLSLLGFQTPPPTAAPSLPLWPLTQSSPAQPPSFWDQLAANRTS